MSWLRKKKRDAEPSQQSHAYRSTNCGWLTSETFDGNEIASWTSGGNPTADDMQRALDDDRAGEVVLTTTDGRIQSHYWVWPKRVERTGTTITYWGVVTPRDRCPDESSLRAGIRFDTEEGLDGERLWFIYDELPDVPYSTN